jgi:DOPA 4,5-dioxygenase
MNQEVGLAPGHPPTDIKQVLEEEIKEYVPRHRTLVTSHLPFRYHFHIYFHQKNGDEHKEALTLRNAVLRLRRAGAFVAVPLWRVNEWPMGPHPVGEHIQVSSSSTYGLIQELGSYEIWCPTESFASVFSYLCQHHGSLRSVLFV